MIKTFRGLLTDSSPGNQNRIRLQTIKGKVGYKIVKFQIMPKAIGTTAAEFAVKIFKSEQSTVDGNIDFTDSDLLAAAILKSQTTLSAPETPLQVIFDNEVFNQDIYVTNNDADSSSPINYYIELEVIPLDDAGAEYTTLKDMRQP